MLISRSLCPCASTICLVSTVPLGFLICIVSNEHDYILFLGSVESCIIHRLKKRAGGLLPAANNSDEVLSKLTKYCPTAENVFRLSTRLCHMQESKGIFSPGR